MVATPGTSSVDSATAEPAEELTWADPVVLAGESRPPRGLERAFVLRLHGTRRCRERIAPGTHFVDRSYDVVRADTLCPACTSDVVASSTSSVLRRLRDAEQVLLRLRASAATAPVPREIVHCRALRYEAESAVSVHPAVPGRAAEVAALAGEVAEAIREGLRTKLAPR